MPPPIATERSAAFDVRVITSWRTARGLGRAFTCANCGKDHAAVDKRCAVYRRKARMLGVTVPPPVPPAPRARGSQTPAVPPLRPVPSSAAVNQVPAPPAVSIKGKGKGKSTQAPTLSIPAQRSNVVEAAPSASTLMAPANDIRPAARHQPVTRTNPLKTKNKNKKKKQKTKEKKRALKLAANPPIVHQERTAPMVEEEPMEVLESETIPTSSAPINQGKNQTSTSNPYSLDGTRTDSRPGPPVAAQRTPRIEPEEDVLPRLTDPSGPSRPRKKARSESDRGSSSEKDKRPRIGPSSRSEGEESATTSSAHSSTESVTPSSSRSSSPSGSQSQLNQFRSLGLPPGQGQPKASKIPPRSPSPTLSPIPVDSTRGAPALSGTAGNLDSTRYMDLESYQTSTSH
uniref:Uncharacterized protein n=1 Tax=Bombyx mori TaxID=7091 RepID=A0A8R2M9K6_BOMMO|nr:mucin-5AC-like [Bombyx mori]